MLREMFKSKIHRATVTDADLNYEGSITIDKDLMDAAGIYTYEKVEIYNINNGARFATYTIDGERGSGEICLNGAAARHVQKGDLVIIASYAMYNEEELETYEPVVIQVDEFNTPKNSQTASV
ncbi:MAG: aspartate 1-decarboxylase [Flexistipes sinusarabici]|uniref:Aspartate 1-decarboxylase n=1 Tax=Flexistipes sinusarabici TaxID=2352 RepID=A0A5D0MWD9_FLESI|nr:aspartate 1-decarboxylase [Flexistipes sinusarabici]TYB36459.1 MAG: aspartate 1-decarboxylase [Flexistipes sinusarabici]